MVTLPRIILPFLCAVFALLPATAAAAEIRVQIDRDPVPIDESFQITFEADGDVDGDPDFTPLRSDFQVLSTGQSSHFTIVNGKATHSKSWVLTVLARRSGRVPIPSIPFGGDRSPAQTVTIVDAGAATQTRHAWGEVFLEVEAKPLTPYVQSQIIYTVRLFLGVAPANASLSEPELDQGNAVIERLGEDKSYETRVMGQRFDVIERKYAVFPQASGKLTLAPVRFQGQIGRSAFSILDPFGPQPQTLVRQSAPVTIDVKPIPAAFTGAHWLPARQLRINEDWSAGTAAIRAGVPVTRTLTLTGDGLTASQLPELAGVVPAYFKAYPDQPLLADKKTGADIIGSRQEKIALIPSRAGEYVLPEISIPWWNTLTDSIEVARVPERRVTVLAAAGGSRDMPVQSPVAGAPPRAVADVSPPATLDFGVGAEADKGSGETTLFWQAMSVILALGWLATLVWSRRARRSPASPGNQKRAASLEAVNRRLKQACARDDAASAKQAVLEWARISWPDRPPRSLGEIGLRCSPEIQQELQKLNAALYGRRSRNWAGREFWQVFERRRPAETRPSGREHDLEPLYRL